MTEVDVRGSDVSGLAIPLQPTMTLSGRVVFDGTSLARPQALTSVRVGVSVDPATSKTLITAIGRRDILRSLIANDLPSVSTTVRDDGTFAVTGLLPARYHLTAVVSSPSGWWLRSAVAGTRDLLDANLDVPPGGNITDAVLTFSDRHTELSGRLQTGAGTPATDYFVVVFPENAAAWRSNSRQLKSARPASDGSFKFADLPPGTYVLAALTDVIGDEWQEPATLQQLAAQGVKVAIGEGEKKNQNLQIGR